MMTLGDGGMELLIVDGSGQRVPPCLDTKTSGGAGEVHLEFDPPSAGTPDLTLPLAPARQTDPGQGQRVQWRLSTVWNST